jgi:acyl-CoA dehydrogenase
MTAQGEGRVADALAGATPYQRLFGLAAGSSYLAKGALAGTGDSGETGRVALCRFCAENLLGETAVLRDAVTTGSEGLEAARAALAE